MRKNILGTMLALAMVTLAAPSYAQFGGLGNALGGGSSSSGVSADSLVKSYVGGAQQVMNADTFFLKALGRKEEAERSELEAKNLTSGATVSALQDAAKVQSESSKALQAAMGGEKVTMSADSKKLYAQGLVELVKGLKTYVGMSGDLKGFKPSVSSLGSGAAAAAFIIKSMPDTLSGLKGTLKRSIDFAKENKIEIPTDATNML
ncbi:hypothetical protein GTP23_19715 [Pseudoduganella sp. FT93W]|uniref:DUF4197 family protein n=1 Tax=Duganella fentianensis TaxID=2692177 RepID=A0A845I624_9BURK|nr:hypothetical protein [Duganella fentianensis]MYN47276.1 hypothetical protein [Duganella fentianensis]